MRIVLADLASADGFVSKDTVVGGYGSRLRPFSRVTGLVCAMKRHLHDLPSVQLGYLAALCAAAGHDVVYTEGTPMDGMSRSSSRHSWSCRSRSGRPIRASTCGRPASPTIAGGRTAAVG